MQMWQKLLQIFETKLRLSRANDLSNAGVGTIAAPNDEQQRDIRPIGDKFWNRWLNENTISKYIKQQKFIKAND